MKLRSVFSTGLLQWVLVGSTVILGACGGGSSSNEVSFGNDNEDPIVGSWLYVYPNSQCEELWSFDSEAGFTRSALDEEASGSYEVTELSGSDRSSLNLNFQADNGEADCTGSSVISSGNQNWFIEIANDQLSFFVSASVTSASLVLDKQ